MRGADVSGEGVSDAGVSDAGAGAGVRARRRAARVDRAVGRVMMAALGFGGVVAWGEREWLGARIFWLGLAVGVVGASTAWVWRAGGGPWQRPRPVALLVAGALTAAVVAATAWGRRPGESALSDRIQGRDLPPVPVFALVPAFLLVAACVVLAARRHRADGEGGTATTEGGATAAADAGTGTGAMAGRSTRPAGAAGARVAVASTWAQRWRASRGSRLVAALTLTAAVVALLMGIGGLARAGADRWAESATTDRVARRPTERVTAGPTGGPEEPGRRAWQHRIEHVGILAGMAAVPGWDVVITSEEPATDEITSVVAARRATTGDLLWRYQRDGDVDQVTVDPEARRVLLVSANSVIVLDLVHGEELVTLALPDDLWCGDPVDEDFARDVDEEVGVGPVAVSTCYESEGEYQAWQGRGLADDEFVLPDTTTAVIDVATGEVVRRLRPPVRDCVQAAVTVSQTTYIAHWGQLPCEKPTIVAVGAGGRVRGVLEQIPAHTDGGLGCATADCHGSALRAGGGSLVLELQWVQFDDDPLVELVAVDPDGEIRWRRDAVSTSVQGFIPPVEVAGVTGHGIAILAGGEWRLLSLTDGAVVAHEPISDPNEVACDVPATDGERLYAACAGGVYVRRADDLARLDVARVGGDALDSGAADPHVTAGVLLFRVWDPHDVIVAY